jgi:hypothetical protein
MASPIPNLGEDLSGFLATLGQPIEQAAREMTSCTGETSSPAARQPSSWEFPAWSLSSARRSWASPTSASLKKNGGRRSRKTSEPECRSYRIRVRGSPWLDWPARSAAPTSHLHLCSACRCEGGGAGGNNTARLGPGPGVGAPAPTQRGERFYRSRRTRSHQFGFRVGVGNRAAHFG